MSAFDGDYPNAVAIEDIEPSPEELDLIDKEGLPLDLFDDPDLIVTPNGVDLFNADPYPKYMDDDE